MPIFDLIRFSEKAHRGYHDSLHTRYDASVCVTDIEYGAIGDGVTDNTAAFLEAIAAGGGHILVPVGTFRISASLFLTYGQGLIGVSKTDSIIEMVTDNTPIIVCNGHSIQVSNLKLRYVNQQENTDTQALAISLGHTSVGAAEGGCHESTFSHLIIEKPYNGFALPVWAGAPFTYGCVFDDIRILDHAEYAVRIEPAAGEPTTLTFRNVYALAQANWDYPVNTVPKGFYFDDCAEVVLDNCSVDWCQDDVVHLNSCDMVTISSLHIESCRVKTNNRGLLYMVSSPNVFAGGLFFYGNKLEGLAGGNFMSLILNDDGYLHADIIVERTNTYTTVSSPRFVSDGSGATAETLADKVVTSSAGFTNLLRGPNSLGAHKYLLTGTGTPEAARTAAIGSVYMRTNGGANTTFYVKESGTGNTGWVAK